jgi:type IV secretion system protein VirB9
MMTPVWVPSVSLLGFLTTIACVSSQAHAALLPAPTSIDERVRTVAYVANQVYELQARIGYQIELQFEEGEELLGHGAGDLAGIEVAAFRNRVFLKPKVADVRTNLMLVTTRREYRFDYEVEASQSDDCLCMYVVQFMYPPMLGVPRMREAERVDEALRKAVVRVPRNVDYWYCGDLPVRPVAASDDGVHTRIRFEVHAELPAIFVRNDDGSESLLNFSMDEGDVIVHRVAHRLIVRRGALQGCIVNQGFVGRGERLDSGTVTREVVRERKEAQP